MKQLILTATVLAASITGTQAQTPQKPVKQFPPIEKKELNLNYLDKNSSSVLDRLSKSGVTSINLQKKEAAKTNQSTIEKPKPGMPTLLPDPLVQFPMHAARPDSTTRYHLQVRKSD